MAMFDASCPKCKRRFGWQGTLLSKVPCPHCGHVTSVDPKDLKAMQDFKDYLLKRTIDKKLTNPDSSGPAPSS